MVTVDVPEVVMVLLTDDVAVLDSVLEGVEEADELAVLEAELERVELRVEVAVVDTDEDTDEDIDDVTLDDSVPLWEVVIVEETELV